MVEIIHSGARAPHAKIALFDFDGTISLIRTGWMEVMVPMMVEILAEPENRRDRRRAPRRRRGLRLAPTGKETMYQMIELANQVKPAAARRSIRSNTSTTISTACRT